MTDMSGGPGGRGWQGPQTQYLLGHHADLHTEDATLLFGGGPLQAHVSAGEFHGEFHLDLLGGKAATTPQGVSAQGVPPKTQGAARSTHRAGMGRVQAEERGEGLDEGSRGWVGWGRDSAPGHQPKAGQPTHCADTSCRSRLTPFISITSVCQFLVSTVCGSSCRERKKEKVRERGDSRDQTRAPRAAQAQTLVKVQEDGAGGRCSS